MKLCTTLIVITPIYYTTSSCICHEFCRICDYPTHPFSLLKNIDYLTLSLSIILLFFLELLLKKSDAQTTPAKWRLDLPISMFSLFIVFIVCFIGIKGRGRISNFAILIGIIVGRTFYALLSFLLEELYNFITALIRIVPFASYSSSIRPLLSNGLLVGILLSIILDLAVKWGKYV